jgi:ribosomal protein S12 methylthiotransferase
VIRSTFIAGFPGETEEEFQHLLDFMREAQIDRAGCFAYSRSRGGGQRTPGMLPAELREERRARFMAVAEEVSAQRLQRVGATMQVLVDSAPALGRRGGVGRSYADAPEIDGVVRCCRPRNQQDAEGGEFTRARIVAAEGHDLVAVPLRPVLRVSAGPEGLVAALAPGLFSSRPRGPAGQADDESEVAERPASQKAAETAAFRSSFI